MMQRQNRSTRLFSSPAAGQPALRRALGALACALALLGGLMAAPRGAGAAWDAPLSSRAAAPHSASNSGAPAAAQDGPAATWTGFYPSGWVTALPLSTGVTVNAAEGFDPQATLYRTSTNGGVTWSAWGSAGLNASLIDPTTLQIAVNGLTMPDSSLQNRVQFQVTTGASQVEQSAAYILRVDTVAPAAPSAMASTPSVWTNVNGFRESWTNPADTSGIAGAFYRLNTEPVFPSDGSFVTTTTFIDNIQVPNEGSHHILVWLMDGAGNVDHANYRVHLNAFRYDATAPSVEVASQGPLGQNGWYTGTVTLNFTPADALSGVQSWGWRLDGGPVSTDLSTVISAAGVHNLLVTAADHAGNAMPALARSIAIDPELPQLGHSVVPNPSASGWYTAPITVSFVLTDLVSGPAGVTWQLNNNPPGSGNSIFLAQDGPYTLAARGADLAGNQTPRLSLSLPLDSHPPVTTLALNPPAPQPSGFYTRPVTLQFQASDVLPTTPPIAGSGVAGTKMRINDGPWQGALAQSFTNSGIFHVDYYSFDVAGNREISRTAVISVDLEPPDAPIAPAIAPADWSASNAFSLSWQSPPDASGIAGAYVWIGVGLVNPADAVFYAETSRIDGLAAPGEGEWPVWMALRDGAGHLGAFTHVGNLRFDASPPTVQAEVTGPPGNAGWLRGPAQVALSIADSGSGPELLRYRLNGGPWQQTASAATLTISAAGRHVLDYYGQDRAGFLAGPYMTAVRIDADPPTAPVAAAVTPTTWSNASQWTLSWRNPIDASGVALAHWSWQPPATPQGGQTQPAVSQTLSLTPPAEGIHDLYLWLEDMAGNSSLDQMAALPGVIRYDATPPNLAVTLSPAPSASGWYRSPVLVTIEASDDLSGLAQVTWQVNDQPPANSLSFLISDDGSHTLQVRTLDVAGNINQEEHQLRIDTQAPQAQLMPLPSYHRETAIPVQWSGNDGEPAGSGLAGFDVQVRQGSDGAWQSWLSSVSDTGASYTGQRGQAYSFRVRAIDAAGNVSPWNSSDGRNTVLVDAITNGAFSTQNFSGWETAAALGLSLIQETELYPGQIVPAARLGSPIWQACADPGNIPTLECGDSWSSIAQSFTVPNQQAVARPMLEFWYRVQSYDQMTTTSAIWNIRCPLDPQPPFRWVDSFDVTVQAAGAAEPAVLLRAGNTEAQFPEPIEFRDMQWQRAEIDLSAYAGQTITLQLASHNRLDSRFNTYTDVYGMRVRGALSQVFLPLASVNAGPVAPPAVCWPNRGADSQDGADAPLMSPLSAEDYLR